MRRLIGITLIVIGLCLLAAIPVLAVMGDADVVEVGGTTEALTRGSSQDVQPYVSLDWMTVGIVVLVVLLVVTAVLIAIRGSVQSWKEKKKS